MRWLPALICWIALPLVSAPALAVGGAGTLGAVTNDGQGVGLPTTPGAMGQKAMGRGGADNVVLDLTGNILSPEAGAWLGSLTAGGAKRIR
jgi:hypothetical protein